MFPYSKSFMRQSNMYYQENGTENKQILNLIYLLYQVVLEITVLFKNVSWRATNYNSPE